MPGRKQRTIRRKKIRPPHRRVSQESTTAPPSAPTEAESSERAPPSTPTGPTPAPQTPSSSSASRKKLSKAPHTRLSTVTSSSDDEPTECGNKLVILEIDGLNETLKGSVCCKECSGGPVVLVQDHTRKEGSSTHPSLQCEQCGATNKIPFSTLPPSHKALTVAVAVAVDR